MNPRSVTGHCPQSSMMIASLGPLGAEVDTAAGVTVAVVVTLEEEGGDGTAAGSDVG